MRRYVFYFWTSDEADDYEEQYGLSVDDTILKNKTDCMLFGTKIGEFDNLKDATDVMTAQVFMIMMKKNG